MVVYRRSSPNDDLGQNIGDGTVLVGNIRVHIVSSPSFFHSSGIIVSMGVRVSVFVGVLVLMIVRVTFVVVVVVMVMLVAVGVTVAPKDEEPDEVREETRGTDDEDELRIVNLGGFDKSSQGLEDDGYAEGDEEDRVEESAQDFGAHPLRQR